MIVFMEWIGGNCDMTVKQNNFIIPKDFKKIEINYLVATKLLRHVINNQNDPVITYSELTRKLPFEYNPRNLDKPLGVISSICIENALPPISSIVVNKDFRLPGEGFYREFYSGRQVSEWKDIFEKCKSDVINCGFWQDILEAIEG